MSKFRILSIDGGGLRGIVPVLILKELERRTGKRIHEMFDLIAGTSTGGLITCAVTASENGVDPKFTLDQIEDVYVIRGKEIFPRKKLLGRIFGTFTALKNPKFSADGLNNVLSSLLGELRLSDCLKPVLIPTYDINHNEAIFFKKRHAVKFPENNTRLFDVCRATSAGPTYLPAYQFNYENKERLCIDGGVYINNPAVAAIVEVSRYHDEYGFPGLAWEDICCLSLGTGHYTDTVLKKKIEDGGGQLDWAVPISDVMMQGVNETTCYEADELLEDKQFLRLSIDIENEDYSDMADSRDETRNYLIRKVNEDIIMNPAKMKELDEFIEKAGLKEVVKADHNPV